MNSLFGRVFVVYGCPLLVVVVLEFFSIVCGSTIVVSPKKGLRNKRTTAKWLKIAWLDALVAQGSQAIQTPRKFHQRASYHPPCNEKIAIGLNKAYRETAQRFTALLVCVCVCVCVFLVPVSFCVGYLDD